MLDSTRNLLSTYQKVARSTRHWLEAVMMTSFSPHSCQQRLRHPPTYTRPDRLTDPPTHSEPLSTKPDIHDLRDHTTATPPAKSIPRTNQAFGHFQPAQVEEQEHSAHLRAESRLVTRTHWSVTTTRPYTASIHAVCFGYRQLGYENVVTRLSSLR
jgi:hypothetical protein